MSLVGVGDDEGRPAGLDRRSPEGVEERLVVVGVDVDDVGAEGPDFAVQGDRSLASSVVAPCWMWLRSATTMRLSSSNWAAAMRASQFEPSWSSPSPVRTRTRRGEPSILAARASPTAMGRPRLSGPVPASTPGTLVRAGWPLRRESGWTKVSNSAAPSRPAAAKAVYGALAACPLEQDDPVAVGVGVSRGRIG